MKSGGGVRKLAGNGYITFPSVLGFGTDDDLKI